MALIHYFSKDPNKRAKFIFNFIAPFYEKLVGAIEKKYKEAIKIINDEIPLKDKKILDIGTGTGVWGRIFLEYGAKEVTGVDFAAKMVKVAKRTYPEMSFLQCDAEKLSAFEDNSFDIVTASFVLHGVKKDLRLKMLEQMRRVASQWIIIHDFAGKVDFYIQILEFLERSDFKNFKKNFCTELKDFAGNCKLLKTENNTGLYIAKV